MVIVCDNGPCDMCVVICGDGVCGDVCVVMCVGGGVRGNSV